MSSLNFGKIKVGTSDLRRSIKSIEELCSIDTIGGTAANWSQITKKLQKAISYLDDIDDEVDSKEKEYDKQDEKGK